MNKIPNRQAICNVLLEKAKTDKDIVVLCSDSRGSASLAPFFKEFPDPSLPEQNLRPVFRMVHHPRFKAVEPL